MCGEMGSLPNFARDTDCCLRRDRFVSSSRTSSLLQARRIVVSILVAFVHAEIFGVTACRNVDWQQ
jgi:hypothetical protein